MRCTGRLVDYVLISRQRVYDAGTRIRDGLEKCKIDMTALW